MRKLLSDLRLMIVSDDWFGRSLYKTSAAETGLFQRIILVDDGYTALAETWQAVEEGWLPDIILVDYSSCDDSAGRLVAELRADPITENVFVAAFVGEDRPAPFGIDFVTQCDALHPELASVLAVLASVTRAGLGQKALP